MTSDQITATTASLDNHTEHLTFGQALMGAGDASTARTIANVLAAQR